MPRSPGLRGVVLGQQARDRARDASLRRDARRLLRQLEMPLPFDAAALCRRLGEMRGTPITLLEWNLDASGPSGLLISRAGEDVIVYQSNTSRAHQDHIILHEIGHIVAADRDDAPAPRPLMRSAYSEREERDAELVASTIMHRAMAMSRRVRTAAHLGEHSVHNSLGLWSDWA